MKKVSWCGYIYISIKQAAIIAYMYFVKTHKQTLLMIAGLIVIAAIGGFHFFGTPFIKPSDSSLIDSETGKELIFLEEVTN